MCLFSDFWSSKNDIHMLFRVINANKQPGSGWAETGHVTLYHEMSCNRFMHSVEYEMLKYPKFIKNWNLVAYLIKTLEETPALCPLLFKIHTF